jgi:hypothetical protein
VHRCWRQVRCRCGRLSHASCRARPPAFPPLRPRPVARAEAGAELWTLLAAAKLAVATAREASAALDDALAGADA